VSTKWTAFISTIGSTISPAFYTTIRATKWTTYITTFWKPNNTAIVDSHKTTFYSANIAAIFDSHKTTFIPTDDSTEWATNCHTQFSTL
jgi:hypothetical protein